MTRVDLIMAAAMNRVPALRTMAQFHRYAF